MKSEYDFSAAERGKFFRENVRLVPPIHLDADVVEHLVQLKLARRNPFGGTPDEG
jgi:hypothetical protein